MQLKAVFSGGMVPWPAAPIDALPWQLQEAASQQCCTLCPPGWWFVLLMLVQLVMKVKFRQHLVDIR